MNNDNATTATLAWSYVEHKVTHHSRPSSISEFLGTALSTPFQVSVLTPRRVIELEALQPKHRLVLSGRHLLGNLWAGGRLSYFGGWQACTQNNNICEGEILHTFPSALLLDLEVGYVFARDYRIAIGVDNVLDHYVQAVELETLSQGNARPASTPYDYNGRHLYARFTADLF